MQVVVDSLLTNYDRSGDKARSKKSGKPTVVLLHGWADNATSWQRLRERLSDDYDVIAINLPGFGGTERPASAWGLSEYAAFVAAFLKKINVNNVHAFVGHSNGGAMAVRGLAEGTLQADKLVLLAAAGIRTELQGRKALLRVLTKTGKVLSYPLPSGMRKRIRKQLYTTVGSDMLVAEHMEETFKKVITDDIQSDAAKLTMPTLLMYGEDDRSTPVHYGRILHHLIAGSTLEVLGDTGHFIHHDQAEAVEASVAEFLQ